MKHTYQHYHHRSTRMKHTPIVYEVSVIMISGDSITYSIDLGRTTIYGLKKKIEVRQGNRGIGLCIESQDTPLPDDMIINNTIKELVLIQLYVPVLDRKTLDALVIEYVLFDKLSDAHEDKYGPFDMLTLDASLTDLSLLFDSCYTFNTALKWNTGHVTNMSGMFRSASLFNQSLANFNTSNVTKMSCMFFRASLFNQSLANFDTSQVTHMQGMFAGAFTFNQSLANFNTSKVMNMSTMFFRADSFNQSLENFDTSNVNNMSRMFCGAASFNQSLTNFDMSKVSHPYKPDMFYDAVSLSPYYIQAFKDSCQMALALNHTNAENAPIIS